MKRWRELFVKKAFNLFITFLIVCGVAIFCEKQTDGFRLQEIFSDVETCASEETSSQEISSHLLQSFTYLGKGEQFYAFLGEDEKTVLKFFRHRTSLKQIFGLEKRDLTPLFESAKLAYERLKEETALIALHLNTTENLLPTVTLFDNLGIAHQIELDRTEFILQQRAEPFCTALETKMSRGDVEGAKRQIRSLMGALCAQCEKGVHNSDTAFKRNFGAIGERAVCIDIGSLWQDDRVKAKENAQEEIARTSARLQRWLKKHYPELLNTYEDAKKDP